MNPLFAAVLMFGPNGVDVKVSKLDGVSRLSLGNETFRQTGHSVDSVRTLTFANSSLKVMLWDEVSSQGTEHFSAIAPSGTKVARVAESSNELKLRYGNFDPLRKVLPVDSRLAAGESARMVIVQFVSQPMQEYRDAIAALGGQVENYLPDNAYVVEIAADKQDELRALPFVRWVGALQPGWRLEEEVIRALQLGTLKEGEYNLQIGGDSKFRKQRVAADVQLAGGQIVDCPAEGTIMVVRLTPEALVNVARIDGVLFLDRKGKPEADMDNVRVVSGANYVQSVGNFQGQGVKAHVIDGGFRATHVDSAGRVTVRSNSGDTNHGTSTTGIVWGNGTGNATGKGMLPLAQGVFSVYTVGWTGAARLALTQDTVNVHNCVVESNSWGDTLTGSYTTISSYMDEIIYKTDLTICNSMSNWGTNTQVRPQAWAKNIVSIGGVNHFNDQNTANDAWQNTGSIGPAADGRMKPELCFYYDSIFCPTDANNSAYTTGFGGTSAATPMSTGVFGLAYQVWGEGNFGNTCLGPTIFANRMHSSTAKALVVNQAKTYSNTQNDMERMRQGWGLPNIQNVYDNRDSMFIVDESDVLLNLESKTYTVYVAPGTPSFKASMAFTDYWAAPNANPTRVNSLSLKVTDPSGVVYYGNNGMLGLVDAPNVTTAGGAPDSLNNLQNVWINNPASGKWTITVKAESLVQDGRTETPGVTDADFGLVVSGVKYSVVPSVVAPYRPLCLVSGGTTEIYKSDNSNVLLRTPLQAAQQQFVQSGVVVTGTSPMSNPASLRLVAEGQTNLTSNRLKIRYWNYQIGDWEDVSDTAATTNTDSAVTVSASGELSRFVDQSTNQIKAAVYFERDTTVPAVQSWASKLDHVRWFVNP